MFRRSATGMMRVRNRLGVLALALSLSLPALLIYAGAALATHGAASEGHRHGEYMTYQNLSSVPTSWYDNIGSGAWEWTSRTGINIYEDLNSPNWIQYDYFPDYTAAWCHEMDLGCTYPTTSGSGDTKHILYVDIFFNLKITDPPFYGNWNDLSTCPQLESDPDVQETATHEFGHAAGWLTHSYTQGDVMASGSFSGCFRILSTNDISRMTGLYADHP